MIGNTAAMLTMIAIMLPCFLFAMYERDGLPFEKVVRNVVTTCWLNPRQRPYRTENFYAKLNETEGTHAQATTPKTRRKAPKA